MRDRHFGDQRLGRLSFTALPRGCCSAFWTTRERRGVDYLIEQQFVRASRSPAARQVQPTPAGRPGRKQGHWRGQSESILANGVVFTSVPPVDREWTFQRMGRRGLRSAVQGKERRFHGPDPAHTLPAPLPVNRRATTHGDIRRWPDGGGTSTSLLPVNMACRDAPTDVSGVSREGSTERQAFPKQPGCPELLPMPSETVEVASNSSNTFASDNAKADRFRSSNCKGVSVRRQSHRRTSKLAALEPLYARRPIRLPRLVAAGAHCVDTSGFGPPCLPNVQQRHRADTRHYWDSCCEPSHLTPSGSVD